MFIHLAAGQTLIELEKPPKTLWTVLIKDPPESFVPKHHENAFIEDRMHDWDWSKGKLRYYSRVRDEKEPVTLFLQY